MFTSRPATTSAAGPSELLGTTLSIFFLLLSSTAAQSLFGEYPGIDLSAEFESFFENGFHGATSSNGYISSKELRLLTTDISHRRNLSLTLDHIPAKR